MAVSCNLQDFHQQFVWGCGVGVCDSLFKYFFNVDSSRDIPYNQSNALFFLSTVSLQMSILTFFGIIVQTKDKMCKK